MTSLISALVYFTGAWVALRLYLRDDPVRPAKAIVWSIFWPIPALVYMFMWVFGPTWSHWVIASRTRRT